MSLRDKHRETVMDQIACVALIGVGATAVMDLWGLARRRLLSVPSPDYGLVGRWLGHIARGRLRHDAISKSPPVPGERALGWTAHYAIGIAFAAILVGVWGIEWVQRPTLAPALLVGVATVAFPFLVMQPAMGAGIAGSRTRSPAAARVQSLVTHTVFGFGLYAAGRAVSALSFA
jgi:hypothetical protein